MKLRLAVQSACDWRQTVVRTPRALRHDEERRCIGSETCCTIFCQHDVIVVPWLPHWDEHGVSGATQEMLARLRWCCVFFIHSQGDAVITLMMGLCQCVLADTSVHKKKHSDKQTSRRSDLILDLLSNIPLGTASQETRRQR